MAVVTSFQIAHLPPDYEFHACLFRNVQNAAFLQQQLLAGNADFQYAFVDAGLVISETHLLASCFRAVNDLHHGRLRSRNVHSEIVFSLSPTNNISASFRTFGIDPSTTRDIVAIKVSTSSNPTASSVVSEHLGAQVEGESLAFSSESLQTHTDWGRVRKAYKLKQSTTTEERSRRGGMNGADRPDGGPSASLPFQRSEIEAVAVGMMALRGS